jgi:hypothetical protein
LRKTGQISEPPDSLKGRPLRPYYVNPMAIAQRASESQNFMQAMQTTNGLLTGDLLGFSASSTICDALNVPLLPFRENDALAKRYAVKFSSVNAAQDVAQIPDADLRFEVILRDIDKQVIPSRQKGITILRRQVVLNFRVFNAYDLSKPVLQTFAAVDPHEDKIPFESKTDDTPERDLVFFDRLVTRTLSLLLQGLAKRDANLLAQVDVKLDAVAPAIPRLNEFLAKAR